MRSKLHGKPQYGNKGTSTRGGNQKVKNGQTNQRIVVGESQSIGILTKSNIEKLKRMLNQLEILNPSSTPTTGFCSMDQLGNIHAMNVSKDCFFQHRDH